MGAAASTGVAAAVASGSDADLKSALDGLTPEAKAKLIAALKTVSASPAVTRVQAALDAIATNSELNACAEVLTKTALKQAAESDARTGEPRPLEGVPIVVKCNIDVDGTLSTASMPGLATWRPHSTAPVAAKLIEAGVVVVAKTSMPEAALFGMGYSPAHGLTLNPCNKAITCSGSSYGTAVCIAAGIVTCGLGTDTGGSLRMPADACGIVGFRPSLGRWSTSGVVPADPTRDTPGPMGATVSEVAKMDAAVTGTPLADYTPADLSGVRVAVPTVAAAPDAPGYKKAIELALAALKAGGAALNEDAADFLELGGECTHERDLCFGPLALDAYFQSHHGCGLTTAGVLDACCHKGTKEFFNDPNAMTRTPPRVMVHSLSEDERKPLVEKYEAELKQHEAVYTKYLDEASADILLLPAGKAPPPKCLPEEESKSMSQLSFMKQPGFFAHYAYGMQLTRLAIPSIALPTAAKHEGLDVPGAPPPAGVLLMGRPRDDVRLLRVALALEAALTA
mmetsp:Transcript_43293/g.120409  ORF Transcript_43293/g.120409 Transcript_43293/m.120409 type:complete len:510 (-) Transcript_43293:153-1682(-)